MAELANEARHVSSLRSTCRVGQKGHKKKAPLTNAACARLVAELAAANTKEKKLRGNRFKQAGVMKAGKAALKEAGLQMRVAAARSKRKQAVQRTGKGERAAAVRAQRHTQPKKLKNPNPSPTSISISISTPTPIPVTVPVPVPVPVHNLNLKPKAIPIQPGVGKVMTDGQRAVRSPTSISISISTPNPNPNPNPIPVTVPVPVRPVPVHNLNLKPKAIPIRPGVGKVMTKGQRGAVHSNSSRGARLVAALSASK